MDHSAALQLQQEMSANSLENMLVCTKSQQEKKPKPQPEQSLNCPRCDSTNTKFCYYNNYSLSQPRYFCKSCRRYWTKGGTLRNVPVGGGCRKNKRSSSSFSSSSKRTQDHHQSNNITTSPNPNNPLSDFSPLTTYDSNDLTLAFARLQKQSTNGQFGFDDPQDQLSILGNHPNNSHFDAIINPTIIPTAATTNLGFLDSLRSNFLESSATNFNSNFYYGFGNNNIIPNINADDVAAHCGESTGQVMLPYGEDLRFHCPVTTPTTSAVTVTTMKQEVCNGTNKEDENRVLWGFPCQINGGDGNMGQVVGNSGRESWSGFAAPAWHGLVNSPLM